LVHFLSSGLIGISYGLLFERESPDFTAGIARGLLYGLVWWFAGSLTFFPILQGLSFTWTRNAAANALPLMAGHPIFGTVTAVVFLAFERRHRNWLRLDPVSRRERHAFAGQSERRLQHFGCLSRALEYCSKLF
jgi:hypothetical protein